MKTQLDCPCGERIEGPNEDELVAAVRTHLTEKHPELEYTREQILFMAY